MELEHLRKDLFSKSVVLRTQAIDKTAFVEKLKNKIRRLHETPVEHRRPLYASLIEFAEIHPTKIRVGLNAPTLPFDSNEPEKRQYKATGTDGGPSGQNLNFKDCEPKNVYLGSRGGSTTVTIGAVNVQVVELPDAIKMVPMKWKKLKINLEDLAKLRWIDGLTIQQICNALERSRSTVQVSTRTLRNGGFSLLNLSNLEKNIIKKAIIEEIIKYGIKGRKD